MYDIAIIGGGINGCGIARDAVGRGLSVLLAEKGDLASGTSSWSTKLIHGGLRYLEYYEFRLVREALKEREVLWSMAPHIIQPARFVLPHHAGLRPAWLLRLGLFLYDHLGGRAKLPGTRVLDLRSDVAGGPLRQKYTRAFEYSDCRVDDARLVILNARDAADRGARILPRTSVTSARRTGDSWTVELLDHKTGATSRITARLLINAAGPWIDTVLNNVFEQRDAHHVRLVKGSHIVVPKLFDHDRCYIFQNNDGRIVFAIPYEGDFTLIGTTDVDYTGDPGDSKIDENESAYLCSTVSQYFRKAVTPEQVVWSFSGVRPLFDDDATRAQEATRDYVIRCEDGAKEGAHINIFGGKLTTYRRLSEEVVDLACGALGHGASPWTAGASLPGGDFPIETLNGLLMQLRKAHPWTEASHAKRLIHTYGTQASGILAGADGYAALGRHFGANLYEREVAYLMAQEWAQSAEDVLWRRTKLGLSVSTNDAKSLELWMRSQKREINS